MKNEEITVSELLEAKNSRSVLLFFCNRKSRAQLRRKELIATLHGNYQVWHNNNLIIESNNASVIVDKYNSIEI